MRGKPEAMQTFVPFNIIEGKIRLSNIAEAQDASSRHKTYRATNYSARLRISIKSIFWYIACDILTLVAYTRVLTRDNSSRNQLVKAVRSCLRYILIRETYTYRKYPSVVATDASYVPRKGREQPLKYLKGFSRDARGFSGAAVEIQMTGRCRGKTVPLENMASSRDRYYDAGRRLLSMIGQWPYQKAKEKLFFMIVIVVCDASIIVTQVSY